MLAKTDRRRFLKSSALAGAGYWITGRLSAAESTSPNERVQIASFGVGGKGHSDTLNAAHFGKVVAICDIDRNTLEKMGSELNVLQRFTDFRELLDQLGDQIDAVTVSTPDHTHAVIAAQAMKLGKHCYCQKPLTHSIWEARQLGRIARENRVATQMGNQGTNQDALRNYAYQIRAGLVGTVREVHVWTNRPIWPQGIPRPAQAEVPAHVDWESWLGPAPWRPYADGAYHAFNWRGWWDFGTGALGDMACHNCNLPFMALDLRDPVAVQAETTGHNRDSFANKSTIRFEFPARTNRPALSLSWYDGGNLPPRELFDDLLPWQDEEGNKIAAPPTEGVLIVGTQARMFLPKEGRKFTVKFAPDVSPLEVDYPRATEPINEELGHVREWFNAMHDTQQPAVSNFPDYAGPLTETVLLGNLAVWNAAAGPGERITWDADKLLSPSHPHLQSMIRREYREGYQL